MASIIQLCQYCENKLSIINQKEKNEKEEFNKLNPKEKPQNDLRERNQGD